MFPCNRPMSVRRLWYPTTRMAWVAALTIPLVLASEIAGHAQPPSGAAQSVTVEMSVIPTRSLGKDAEEKRILAVLDDLDKNQRARMMNVPLADGRLLRILAESIGAR
ncbi:MAG: hypothetical protein AB7F89_02250, partial [Pirellulaceae bacterium]